MPVTVLDPTFDARHELHPARAHMRESLVWCLAIPEQGIGAFVYTWVDAHGKAGAAGVAFGHGIGEPVFELQDGFDVPAGMDFDDWHAGPVHTAHREPLRTCDVTYRSTDMTIEFAWEAIHAPYAYNAATPGFPAFYADERFEQTGRARGSLTVRGVTHEIDAFCHRDHSWGARVWGLVEHYKWLNFMSADTVVHLMDLHAYGRSWLRGYVLREGTMAEITSVDWNYELDEDFFHRGMKATVHDDAGRATTVKLLDTPAELEYPINPRLTLIDLIGHAEIDGAPASSYAEMSWPPEYLQFGKETLL
jgi:hypothetical protein